MAGVCNHVRMPRALDKMALFVISPIAVVACHQASASRFAAHETIALAPPSSDDGFSANCDLTTLDAHASNAFFAGDIAGTEKRPILVYSRHSGMSGNRAHMVIYEDGTATADPENGEGPITIARVIDSPRDVARCVAQKIDGIDYYNGSPRSRDVPTETIEARVGNVWRSVVFSSVGHHGMPGSELATDGNRLADAKSVLIETRMTDYQAFDTPIKRVDLAEVAPPTNEAAAWPANLPEPPTALEWSPPSWGRQATYWIDGTHGEELQTFLASHPRQELIASNGRHVTLLRVTDALPDAPVLGARRKMRRARRPERDVCGTRKRHAVIASFVSALLTSRAMRIVFPGESPEYRVARDRLLAQEIELRRLTEDVAAARRALPPGGVVTKDYVFRQMRDDGASADVKLSQLFSPGKSTLVIYSFMFPRDRTDQRAGAESGETALLTLEESPCPSCVAMLDQFEGAMEHVSQRIDFVVAAKAPTERLRDLAKERDWKRLRLFSTNGNTYMRDYLGETDDGSPRPMVNVFQRDGETMRHFWGSELLYAPAEPGQDPRHLGTLEPLWNIFDLTREGRPANWEEQLGYCCHHADTK
jgi:predicted dithiol-disulfide oxidoreductase (DUF899 family)